MEQLPAAASSCDGASCRFEMGIDDFASCVFAGAAAVCDRQASLHVVQAGCATIHALADLAIADSVTQTNVHGS